MSFQISHILGKNNNCVLNSCRWQSNNNGIYWYFHIFNQICFLLKFTNFRCFPKQFFSFEITRFINLQNIAWGNCDALCMPKDRTKLMHWNESRKIFTKKRWFLISQTLFSFLVPLVFSKSNFSFFLEANLQKIRQTNRGSNQTNKRKNLFWKISGENKKVNKTKWCATVGRPFYVSPAFQQHPSHASAYLVGELEQCRLCLGRLHSSPIEKDGTPATRFPLPLHVTWDNTYCFLHFHSLLCVKQLNPFFSLQWRELL